MPHQKLRDLLQKQVLLSVSPETTVHDAAVRMTERDIHTALVLKEGSLVGLLTGTDVLRRVVAPARDPGETPVGDVMTRTLISIDADRTVFEAYRLMHEYGVRHIVVTGLADGGYGVVSIRDYRFGEAHEFNGELEFEHRVWEEI
jgi:CBS domain-containing protein